MELRRLRVRNIRSYEAADLTLGPGTTLLTGDVGAGKTSLLYAIEMALFGFAEVDPTYLVRHQAPGAEVVLALGDADHRYEFSRRFRRRRRKGKDFFEVESTSYSVDGATTPYSATELRERAIALLGFPDNPNPRAHSDLWRWAVYVPQERMREILAQPATERLETVRKALGLEQYRTAADNAQLVAADLRRGAERREAEARGRDHLAANRPTLEAEARAQTTEAEELAAQREAMATEVAASERRRAEAEQAFERMEQARTELEGLIERLRADAVNRTRRLERHRAAVEELHELERRLAEGPEILRRAEEASRRLEHLTHRVRELDERFLAASRDAERLAAAEARCAALAERAASASGEIARRRQEHRAAEDERQRLAAERPLHEPPAPTPRSLPEIDAALALATSRRETLVAELSRLEHIDRENEELRTAGVCPRCHQQVDAASFGPHLAEVRAALAQERERLAGSAAERDRLLEERRSRERYDRAIQRWTDLESARRRANERVLRAEESLRAGELEAAEQAAALGAARDEVERLRPLAARAEEDRRARDEAGAERDLGAREERRLAAAAESVRLGQAELPRVKARLAELDADAAQEERQRSEHQFRREGLETSLAGADEVRSAREAARAESERRREAVAELDRRVARGRALAESARQRLGEVDRLLTEREGWLAEARADRDLGDWFASEFRDGVLTLEHRLLERAQREFEREFARYFTLLVEDPGLVARCDAGFTPAVEIEGEWTPAEALSGGERTALALAFRLALGQVVRGAGRLRLGLLILDEPTDGFSPEQVTRMGEVLEGLGIPQVLLVSHEMQLASIADRVVRVQKDGGRSRLDPARDEGVEAQGPERAAPLAARARRRTRRLDDASGPRP